MAITSNQLLSADMPGIQWIIEGILPVGLSLTGAAPKAGKSWLWLQVAKAVCNGGVVLGRKVVKRGHVVYLALEDSKERMASRIREQKWEMTGQFGVDFYTMDDFTTMVDGKVNVQSILDSPALIEPMLKPGTALLIIDTFSTAFSGSQTSVNSVREPFVMLRDVARRHGYCIALVDHKNKSGSIFGSVAKTGFADSIWEINGSVKDGEAKLSITGKDTTVDEVDMVWDDGKMSWLVMTPKASSASENLTYKEFARLESDDRVYSFDIKYDKRRGEIVLATITDKPVVLGIRRTVMKRGRMPLHRFIGILNGYLSNV